MSDLVANLTRRHPGRHSCRRDVSLRCAGHFQGMKGVRPPAVADLSLDEKAVWPRTYSSAYKRARTAASSDCRLTRRRELRGDVVGSSSGLPMTPKEVAMAAAQEERSRFRAARDPCPRAPTVPSTTPAVPQLPLPSPQFVSLVGVTAPPPWHSPASPSASSPYPPGSSSFLSPRPPLSDGEVLDLVDCSSVCGAGAPNLRRSLAVCGPVACPQADLARSVESAVAARRCFDALRAGNWALGGPLVMVRKLLAFTRTAPLVLHDATVRGGRTATALQRHNRIRFAARAPPAASSEPASGGSLDQRR